ncbi:MAG: sulfatase-like hydrolase/transferase [Armatimonadota bacterium]
MPNNETDRRRFLKTMGLGAAALALPGRLSVAQNRPPNIVFIFIDDMGWRDLGFMGSRYYETPNVDKLASQGMVFRQAYTNAPNCAPTRACLLSGQYGPRHGVYTVGTSERGQSKFRKLIPTANTTDLRLDIVTIPEALKAAGYVSACIGKWHLGGDAEHSPKAQGFDVSVDRGGLGYRGHFKRGRTGPADEDEPEYLTDRLTDESLKFIEDNRDKPFFLYLAHHAVHTPIQAKRELIEKYQAKPGSGGQSNPKYAAMVDSVDQSVGRVMDKLDELNLTDNTVVVFFTDNGGVGGYQRLGIQGGEITSNLPLRGGKGMLYEGGIRVPMIVRWPGQVEPGSKCDVPVIGTDYYPTFLEMAGLEKAAGQVLDGESLVPLLKQTGSLKRDAIFWHFPAYLQGGGGTWRTTPAGAIRQGDFKLIEFFEDGTLELYNINQDIGEENNLAEEMPEKVRQLHRRLLDWRKSVKAPVPTEPNPEYDPEARPE